MVQFKGNDIAVFSDCAFVSAFRFVVCATYAHQKEVNFCTVFVFVLCRLTLSCLFAQHLKGQRQDEPYSQPVKLCPCDVVHVCNPSAT